MNKTGVFKVSLLLYIALEALANAPRACILDKPNENFGFSKVPPCFENEISVAEL